jgi:hypothetical protein
MIKEQAARLAACINDINALTQLLCEFTERFQIGCRQNIRNTHPNTWRQLAEGCYELMRMGVRSSRPTYAVKFVTTIELCGFFYRL